MPTTINNVETLAAVPHILNRGAEWYKALCLGNPKSTGTKLFSVCGHVQRPGNYEVTMGTPDEGPHLRHVRRHAAGPHAQGGDPGRLLGADHDARPRPRTALLDYEGIVAQRLDARLRRHDRHGRLDRHGVPDLAARPLLRARVAAPSAPSAARAPPGPPRSSSGSWRGRARRRTSTCCSISSENMTGKTICVLSDSCAAPGRERHPEVPRRVRRLPHRRAPAGARDGLTPMTELREPSRSTGAQVSVPEGHLDHRGRQAGRRPDPALLLPPVAAVAGVCRMCLVEVEKAPKLMPACVTTVAEGQVVHVNSAQAPSRRARACSSSC